MSKSHLTCFCGMLSPWGCLALSLTCHAPYSHLMWLSAGAPFAAVEGYGEGGRQIKYSGTISVKSVRIKNILHFFRFGFRLVCSPSAPPPSSSPPFGSFFRVREMRNNAAGAGAVA